MNLALSNMRVAKAQKSLWRCKSRQGPSTDQLGLMSSRPMSQVDPWSNRPDSTRLPISCIKGKYRFLNIELVKTAIAIKSLIKAV